MENTENNNEAKKPIIYTTPSCMYCNMLKAYLDENEIDYETFDVSEDIEKAQYLAEKTGQMGVPVTEINGEFIIGFDQAKIAEMLNIEE